MRPLVRETLPNRCERGGELILSDDYCDGSVTVMETGDVAAFRSRYEHVALGFEASSSSSYVTSGIIRDRSDELVVEWTSLLPGDIASTLGTISLGAETTLSVGGEATDFRFFDSEQQLAGAVQHEGLIERTESTLRFEVTSDPFPLAIIAAVVLSAGCILDWKVRGGREKCMSDFKDLSNLCMAGGGHPSVIVRSVLGVAFGPVRLGCHLECQFVCSP
jgi:hypothetical protein